MLAKSETLPSSPLPLSVGANSGGPRIDPAQPRVVYFDMAHVHVEKGAPIVLFQGVFGALLLGAWSAYQDVACVRAILDPRTLRRLLVPLVGWASADVCQILANERLNAALYIVISQSRLVGTAACTWSEARLRASRASK